MKTTKRSLLTSAICLLLTAVMLMGSTFAWFTDSVTNEGNTIQAGELNVGFQYKDLDDANAAYALVPNSPEAAGALFTYTKWEPGYAYGYDFQVSNDGSLALKWQLYFTNIQSVDNNEDGVTANIADVIDVYIIGVNDGAAALTEANKVGTLSSLVDGFVKGNVLTAGAEEFSLVLKMQKTAGNAYQDCTVTFNLELRATQAASETDGFGNPNYDAGADGNPDQDWGSVVSGSVTEEVAAEGDTVLNLSGVTVTVPQGAAEEDTLTLTVEPAQVSDEIPVEDGMGAAAYRMAMRGLAADNETPVEVALFVGKGYGDVSLYNDGVLVENAVYDPQTGVITFSTTDFGTFTLVYEIINDGNFSGGNGSPEHPYLISTKEDLMKIGYKGTGSVDGKDYFYNHVFRLTNDIDMENTPIRNLCSFRGLLDGNGYSLLHVNFTSEAAGCGSNVGLFAGINGGNNSEIYKATTPEELASEYCYDINGEKYIITSGAVVDLTIESGRIYSNAAGAVSPLGAGQNTGYIINVTNNVDIVAEGEAYFIAGIVFGTRGTGLVINCTNNGDITYNGTPSGSLVVGGITAQLYGGSSGAYPDVLRPYSAAVYGCVNNGNITATGRDVGGIVGQTHGYDAALKKAIVNCTNTGNVAGMENVGGIIGRNSSTGKTLYLLNNTNTGTVSLLEGGVAGTCGDVYGKNDGVILDNAQ